MDILSELTPEQQSVAALLDERELALANLWLTTDGHRMTQIECYAAAGYEIDADPKVNAKRACAGLRRCHVAAYVSMMRRDAVNTTRMDLAYLDGQLKELIDTKITDVLSSYARSVGEVDMVTGEVIVVHTPTLKCPIDQLPPEFAGAVQSIKVKSDGVELKMYSRLEAIRTAMQRLGALTNRTELSGPGGRPIELQALSDAELEAKIAALLG